MQKFIVHNWIVDISKNGKTLTECFEENPVLYINNERKLKNARKTYLCNQPLPNRRINIYVYGQSGIGKDCCCKAIAKEISNQSVYFLSGKVKFKDYDGQKVIIWSDYNAKNLISELKGINNVYETFSTNPTQNINSVKLLNEVNIVNDTDNYMDFLNNLQNKEDYDPFYLFPYIIHLCDDTIEFSINVGYATNDKSKYQEYKTIVIKGNFANVVTKVPEFEKDKVNHQLCEPIISHIKETEERLINK